MAAITRTLRGLGHPLGADLLDFAGLEEAQQQALHAQRHLPDFVEEDGAVVGHLELAGLVAIGAREAALHVPEQLGLEQRLRDAGAVDRHEGRLAARAVRVNRAGHDFLARAALAGDEDLGVRPSDALDLRFQFCDRRALPDQLTVSVLPHCCSGGCPPSWNRVSAVAPVDAEILQTRHRLPPQALTMGYRLSAQWSTRRTREEEVRVEAPRKVALQPDFRRRKSLPWTDFLVL